MTSQLLTIFVSLYLSISFQPASESPCLPQALGCALAPNKVWINPKIVNIKTVERNHVIYHESGHIFDFRYMTSAAHEAFKTIMNDHREWLEGINPLAEKFGEAVARCFDGSYNAPVTHTYKYEPTVDQYNRVCRLVRTVYRPLPALLIWSYGSMGN